MSVGIVVTSENVTSEKNSSLSEECVNVTCLPEVIPNAYSSYFFVMGLCAIIAGGILNISVLSAFIIRHSLRNPFAVYLMNLLVLETILVLLHGPFNLIDKLTSTFVQGYTICVYESFMGYTFQNLIIIGHLLIALNRIWAVIFPFSYHVRHSTKFATIMCVSVWLLITICYIPVTIVTAPTPENISATSQCDIYAENLGVWGPFIQLALYDTPIVIIIACYPVVCYKSFFRGRRERLLISPQTVQTERTKTEQLGHPGQVPTSTQPSSIPGPSVPAVIPRRTETLKLCGKLIHIDGSATGFVTLTLMTVSVIVCLMPKEVYYTYQLWTDDDDTHLFFYRIADTLQHLTTVFDPILIVLGNPELQKVILAKLRLGQRYCGFGQ